MLKVRIVTLNTMGRMQIKHDDVTNMLISAWHLQSDISDSWTFRGAPSKAAV